MVFRRITMACMPLLSGCFKPVESPAIAPMATENAWHFEMQMKVETQWLVGSEEDSSDMVPEELLRALGDFEVSWSGEVTEGPYKINRDDTESWRLLFKEVRDEQGVIQPLEGRAMETRRFPGGTLLSLQQAEWVSSSESLGDGLDAMVALMYLLPPERKKDKLLFTDFAWPFRLGAARRSQHTAPLTWEEDGDLFHFEGPLSGRVQDREWNLRAESSGRLGGTMRVSDKGEVLETRFQMERTLLFQPREGEAPLQQKQWLSGVLKPSEASTVPFWPRVFYLNETDVLGRIGEAKADWESCSPEADWSVELDLEIGTDGRVLSFDEEALKGCADTVRGLQFPPHHLPGLRLKTQLVLRSGVYQPYPTVRFPENPKPPLHLLLVPGADAQEVVDLLKSQL